MPNSRNIFLFDGLGALLSALLTGVVLMYFNDSFGMPQEVLIPLAGVACLFAIYSLACHFNAPAKWQPFLRFIAISNTIYCLVSIGFMVYHFEQLTSLGITYFVLEAVVIGTLVFIELKLAFFES